MEEYDVRFKKNFKVIISGGSGSGKSFFLFKLLKNASRLMESPPRRIYYFFQMDQPLFGEIKAYFGEEMIQFIQGAPSADQLQEITSDQEYKPALIVLDDLGLMLSHEITNLFQVGAHHGGLCLILLVQNLFGKNKHSRDISLSASDIILFKSPRDNTVASSLGRQIAPGKSKAFMKLFQEATADPYSYLHIDLTQSCPEFLRLRSQILPEEKPMKCWVLN